jgi:hypothetical protein
MSVIWVDNLLELEEEWEYSDSLWDEDAVADAPSEQPPADPRLEASDEETADEERIRA